MSETPQRLGHSDEYYLAMAALDQYPIEDSLPKSKSVVFRIHQLGRALDAARVDRDASEYVRLRDGAIWQAKIKALETERAALLSALREKVQEWRLTIPAYDNLSCADELAALLPADEEP